MNANNLLHVGWRWRTVCVSNIRVPFVLLNIFPVVAQKNDLQHKLSPFAVNAVTQLFWLNLFSNTFERDQHKKISDDQSRYELFVSIDSLFLITPFLSEFQLKLMISTMPFEIVLYLFWPQRSHFVCLLSRAVCVCASVQLCTLRFYFRSFVNSFHHNFR